MLYYNITTPEEIAFGGGDGLATILLLLVIICCCPCVVVVYGCHQCVTSLKHHWFGYQPIPGLNTAGTRFCMQYYDTVLYESVHV